MKTQKESVTIERPQRKLFPKLTERIKPDDPLVGLYFINPVGPEPGRIVTRISEGLYWAWWYNREHEDLISAADMYEHDYQFFEAYEDMEGHYTWSHELWRRRFFKENGLRCRAEEKTH